MDDVLVPLSAHVIGTVGIVSNSLLIFVIIQCTPASLKDYSHIMLVSAVCDCIGLVAIVGDASKLVLFEWLCFIEYSGLCVYSGEDMCAFLFGVQAQMYSTSVMLLCFAFFYRLCLLDQPSGEHMERMRRICVPAIITANLPLSFLFYKVIMNDAENAVASLPVESYRKAHESAPDVLGVVSLREIQGAALVAYSIVTSFVPFVLSVFLRRLTIRRARTMHDSMSQSAQHLHRILVKILNIQLVLVACFLVGSSFFLIDLMELPFLRNTSILALPLCNLQNVCTPIASLYIITPYRRRIVLFWKRGNQPSSSFVGANIASFTISSAQQNQSVSIQSYR